MTGELIPGSQFTFSGADFIPGGSGEDPVNLSSKNAVSFLAKGDGGTYSVALQSESNSGQMPVFQSFAAGPEWKQYSFPISAFKIDGI